MAARRPHLPYLWPSFFVFIPLPLDGPVEIVIEVSATTAEPGATPPAPKAPWSPATIPVLAILAVIVVPTATTVASTAAITPTNTCRVFATRKNVSTMGANTKLTQLYEDAYLQPRELHAKASGIYPNSHKPSVEKDGILYTPPSP